MDVAGKNTTVGFKGTDGALLFKLPSVHVPKHKTQATFFYSNSDNNYEQHDSEIVGLLSVSKSGI